NQSSQSRGSLLDPFLAKRPEQFAAVSIEFSERQKNRTAQSVAILVIAKRAWLALLIVGKQVARASGCVGLASPRVGIEGRVAKVLVERPVKVVGSALGDNADLSASGPAVFGVVVGGENLDLLRGVQVGGADAECSV